MELLEKYLQAVRMWLPRRQQDDIVRELSENLRAQMEDRKAELGHPLSEAEQEAVLKQHGHPALVAARYHGGRYLIGPLVFPFYVLALKIGVGILAVLHAINAIVGLFAGQPPEHLLGIASSFVSTVMLMFGWVTLAAAVADRIVDRFHLLDRLNREWSPRTLPALQKHPPRKPATVAGAVAATVFRLWFLAGLRQPFLILGPAVAMITFAPVWQRLYMLFLLLAIAGTLVDWMRVTRPQWTWIRWLHRLVEAGGLFVMYLLLKSGTLFVATSEAYNGIALIINAGLLIGLWIGLLMSAAELVWDILRDARKSRGEFNGAASRA